MKENGIYILGHTIRPSKSKKNIDSKASNLHALPPQLVSVTIGSGHGTCRLVGAFKNQVSDQLLIALKLIKNNIFKHTTQNLKQLEIEVDIGRYAMDGPSLGLALFLAVTDGLASVDMPCKVGVTGELSENGNLQKIGHMKEKLENAFKYKIPIIIVPQANIEDVQLAFKNNKKLDTIRVICVSNIFQALLATYNIAKYGIVDDIKV